MSGVRRSMAAVLGLTIAFVLVSCSGEAGPEVAPNGADTEPLQGSSDTSTTSQDAVQPASDAQGHGEFTIDGHEYSVSLAMCSVYDNLEILLHGPALENGTAVGYFDGDVSALDGTSYGEFRIDIGATGQFESTDTFYAFGNTLGGALEISEDGDGYHVVASAWDANGTDLGEASFRFTCT